MKTQDENPQERTKIMNIMIKKGYKVYPVPGTTQPAKSPVCRIFIEQPNGKTIKGSKLFPQKKTRTSGVNMPTVTDKIYETYTNLYNQLKNK